MNTASNTQISAASRAASRSVGQLGKRFGIVAEAAQSHTIVTAPVAAPAVALETVLATYSMFRAA